MRADFDGVAPLMCAQQNSDQLAGVATLLRYVF